MRVVRRGCGDPGGVPASVAGDTMVSVKEGVADERDRAVGVLKACGGDEGERERRGGDSMGVLP